MIYFSPSDIIHNTKIIRKIIQDNYQERALVNIIQTWHALCSYCRANIDNLSHSLVLPHVSSTQPFHNVLHNPSTTNSLSSSAPFVLLYTHVLTVCTLYNTMLLVLYPRIYVSMYVYHGAEWHVRMHSQSVKRTAIAPFLRFL